MRDPYFQPAKTVMLRLKNKLLTARLESDKETKANLPAIVAPRPVGFPASVAEFLLVLRLRVRRPSVAGGSLMERAAQVLLVTCKSWFSSLVTSKRDADKP